MQMGYRNQDEQKSYQGRIAEPLIAAIASWNLVLSKCAPFHRDLNARTSRYDEQNDADNQVLCAHVLIYASSSRKLQM
jgi:hypothetical protein